MEWLKRGVATNTNQMFTPSFYETIFSYLKIRQATTIYLINIVSHIMKNKLNIYILYVLDTLKL